MALQRWAQLARQERERQRADDADQSVEAATTMLSTEQSL
jgi:hypothetical protein